MCEESRAVQKECHRKTHVSSTCVKRHVQFQESPVVLFVRTVLVLDASCHSDETCRHRKQKWWVQINGVAENV